MPRESLRRWLLSLGRDRRARAIMPAMARIVQWLSILAIVPLGRRAGRLVGWDATVWRLHRD